MREVALAGAPNVGKSTLFNRLTRLHQHTGNWIGKTVETARGRCGDYQIWDLPGTWSLTPRSGEEQVARDFLAAGRAEATVVVCDAGCLERDLALALECRAFCPRVLVCVNLLDEAARRGCRVDCAALSEALGLPMLGVCAREERSRGLLLAALDALFAADPGKPPALPLPEPWAGAVSRLEREAARFGLSPSLALPLLEGTGELPGVPAPLLTSAERERAALEARGAAGEALSDAVTAARSAFVRAACARGVRGVGGYGERDRRIDRLLTGRWTAFPLLLLGLLGLLELSIRASNVPSVWMERGFAALGAWLGRGLNALDAPPWLRGLLLDGAWGSLSLVTAVMLPPMAIFFPLFTLLEDLGLLPRVAFALDRPLCACGGCGQQSLCMMMGLGCNAVGVTGSRIIPSRRERRLALLTNAITPCNGRFPLLLALLSAFFGRVDRALGLTLLLLVSILLSMAATWLLSRTLLPGRPSPLTLELPPYRRPELGKLLVRSLLDRTLRVLGRAALVAAPAGALLWCLGEWEIGGERVLTRLALALDPLGRFFGMDGAILLSFLLGLPANETVLPILLGIYGAAGTEASALGAVLAGQGWTAVTAACVLLFTILHWPCSTTLLTVKKETGSWRWTFLAAALPTALGLGLCALLRIALGQ